jgi:nucleotide-binding universal stress UspA family protein
VHTDAAGDVARSLFEHEGELEHDLIVMCTHGRSGLRDLVVGSIAQRVIALGTTPVLLVQPVVGVAQPPSAVKSDEVCFRPFACRRLLVPLDGAAAHEQGLRVAIGLAQACGAALHLLAVMPTAATVSGREAAVGKLLPGATAAMLDMAHEASADYLRHCVAQTQDKALSVTAEVARGDPAATIAGAAERAGADLIVLATHRRKGMDAFWSGSVASKLPGLTALPLLLVPIGEPASGVPSPEAL